MDVGIVCENLSKGDKHVLKLFFTQWLDNEGWGWACNDRDYF
jgi:hypothetical protein